jgi:hypothetical protein
MQTGRHPLATSTAHPRPPKPPCLLRTCLLRVVTSHELLLPPSPLALLNTTSELGGSSIDILPMSLLCTFAGGDEFIRSTGKYLSARGPQAGRLRLAQAIVLSGGLVLVAGWWQRLGGRLTLIGTAIVAVGFLFQCLAVRCPKCRVAVVWHTFCNRKMSEAQMAAMFQVACPNCGFHPDASTERVRREGVVQRADGADEPRP